MIWTNKGLKQRVAELEAEVTSLKKQLKESKFEEQGLVDLCNKQGEMVRDLYWDLEEARKTSSNVVVSLTNTGKKSVSLGQNIARALRGAKS